MVVLSALRFKMLRGILFKVAATMCFTLMAALVKMASRSFGMGEMVFFRSFFALGVIVIWLGAVGQLRQGLVTQRPWGHLARGLIGSCGMITTFMALSLLPLADATAISYATPLITVVLAAVFLEEKVKIYRWSAVVVGFIGVLIMLQEHLGEGIGVGPQLFGMARGTLGAIIALVSAFCAALAMTQTRRLTKTESTGSIVFYFQSLTSAIGLGVALLAGVWPSSAPGAAMMASEVWIWPSFTAFLVLAGSGVFGGLGQIFMTESFRHADASIIAPFDYLTMIWAVFISYSVFGDVPSFWILAGAALVMGSGLFVILREQYLGREPSHMREGL